VSGSYRSHSVKHEPEPHARQRPYGVFVPRHGFCVHSIFSGDTPPRPRRGSRARQMFTEHPSLADSVTRTRGVPAGPIAMTPVGRGRRTRAAPPRKTRTLERHRTTCSAVLLREHTWQAPDLSQPPAHLAPTEAAEMPRHTGARLQCRRVEVGAQLVWRRHVSHVHRSIRTRLSIRSRTGPVSRWHALLTRSSQKGRSCQSADTSRNWRTRYLR